MNFLYIFFFTCWFFFTLNLLHMYNIELLVFNLVISELYLLFRTLMSARIVDWPTLRSKLYVIFLGLRFKRNVVVIYLKKMQLTIFNMLTLDGAVLVIHEQQGRGLLPVGHTLITLPYHLISTEIIDGVSVVQSFLRCVWCSMFVFWSFFPCHVIVSLFLTYGFEYHFEYFRLAKLKGFLYLCKNARPTSPFLIWSFSMMSIFTAFIITTWKTWKLKDLESHKFKNKTRPGVSEIVAYISVGIWNICKSS